MPELPEVETVRRGLQPVLEGRRIVKLEQRRPDLRFPFPENFPERLAGRRIETVNRRSKYLVVGIEGGETLIMHLGMSGRFTIALAGGPATMPGLFTHDTGLNGAQPNTTSGSVGKNRWPNTTLHVNTSLRSVEQGSVGQQQNQHQQKHDHVVFHTEEGATVTYNDPRRFGFMVMTATADLQNHPLIGGLGPEPLGNALHAGHLAARAAGRTVDLKAFLMDQRNIAGLGNIYVCEALFRAGLSPQRAASSLARKSGNPTERAERLVTAIRSVLTQAIAAGGSSLRDYRQADGALGYFQHSFSVYGREGEPCATPACRGTVRRIVQAGRSSFLCPACQR
ncbi:MAG: bifunctional DNA-formamidopyrimidine glycosylase/DNA-(apurinic or apyrimidinic site) lyase [Alphaproteobacteria bacterium]|nr:bifunctional DNA-formamidopyrimidine glycosylase/DNA-(apurinic or apyrimidinic site) lyase [Alphaproteobacteria bacterium]